MSGAIGRIGAALATFHNENSLSLANLNLDFTLVKFEAPKEFRDLGSTISQKRKTNAEEGALHKTARKLGLLFGTSLPKTPTLVGAYGTRVSEIAKVPLVNPQATVKDGIFEGEIGADATSIWAAVTSGTSAVAVHLLACMLARMFTGTEATSVWAEVVEKQKLYLREEANNDIYEQYQDTAMLAAQQDFSRTELANWDASARAWLQSADQAKAKQHNRLKIVLEETNILVNDKRDTFQSVLSAWTAALRAMDNLLQGLPQQVQDGAALIGISSWHMYPDMVVLGREVEDVEQMDPLFAQTAVLTLGLQSVRGGSVSWSLPLARLQHYGRPVHVSRSAGQDNSRITAEQFAYVVLGCVFASWKGFANDVNNGLVWLEKLLSLTRYIPRERGSVDGVFVPNRFSDSFSVRALKYLHDSAQNFIDCQGVDAQLARQLIALGRRRAEFLSPPNARQPPLFGLAHLTTLLPLLRDDDTRVKLLRVVSSRLGIIAPEYVIQYRTEFATVRPIATTAMQSRVKVYSSSNTPALCNVRWLILMPRDIEALSRDKWSFFKENDGLFRRYKQIGSYGELCLPCLDVSDPRRPGRKYVFGQANDWDYAVQILSPTANNFRHGPPRYPFTPSFPIVSPTLIIGSYESGCVCSLNPEVLLSELDEQLRPEEMEEFFAPSLLSAERVTKYLTTTARELPLVRGLEACVAILEIYKLLPNATISTLVLSQPLLNSKWIPPSHGSLVLSRSQTFACIAMLDSGTSNIDPKSLTRVFAMSTGNSIYVAGAMMCDPYEKSGASEIQRVTGNIGRAGISFLLAPPNPNIRQPQIQNWRQINHLPFDGTSNDCFQHTSVHLSFTTYEMPLQTEGERHIVDQPFKLVETLIAVYDRRDWVADLDLLQALDQGSVEGITNVHRVICSPVETNHPYEKFCKLRPRMSFGAALDTWPQLKLTCIDNWDELLEPPETGDIIVRAQNNWLARLALAGTCVQLGYIVVVLEDNICWPCCAKALEEYTMEYSKTQKRIALIC